KQLGEEFEQELDNDDAEIIEVDINEDKIEEYISLMNRDIKNIYIKNDKGDNGFLILGELLSNLSNRDEVIMNIWIDWILKKYNIYVDILIKMKKIYSNATIIPNIYIETLKNRYKNPIYNYTIKDFDKVYM